jgi:hypothetical protein
MNRLGEVDGVFTRDDVLRLRHGCRVVLEQLCASQRGRAGRADLGFSSANRAQQKREARCRYHVKADFFSLLSIPLSARRFRNILRVQMANSLQKNPILCADEGF